MTPEIAVTLTWAMRASLEDCTQLRAWVRDRLGRLPILPAD
jgi:hypothetical protein